MPQYDTISLYYAGGYADQNHLSFYDAARSYEGAARTLAIIGHYYLKREIIHKAPSSSMVLYISPPEPGSFRQNIIAGTLSGLIVAGVSIPFTIFATRMMDRWIPASGDPAIAQIVELLKEQNELLRSQDDARLLCEEKELAQEKAADKFINDNEDDADRLRSITSQSFKHIFRPIESGSAKYMGIIGGGRTPPKKAVDIAVFNRIEADFVDEKDVQFMGIVNSFNRGSKTGHVFSRDFDRGFRFEYAKKEQLPREDVFSWSQYSGQPVRFFGRFVRYFDNRIKKFLVFSVERVSNSDDREDYFRSDREIRPL